MITKEDIKSMDALICGKVGINSDTLFWMKLEYGCAFLKEWIGHEFKTDIKMMEAVPEFWAWWQQVWYNADKRYLSQFFNYTMGSYKYAHDPKTLAYKPNSVVFECYHRLIKLIASSKEEIQFSNHK